MLLLMPCGFIILRSSKLFIQLHGKENSMLFRFIFVVLLAFSSFLSVAQTQDSPIALVIHGGAGTIIKERMTDSMEVAYQQKLTEAIDAGYTILENGGTGLEAIKVAINIMENSPLFNAGKGAVFNHEGKNELDASVMHGESKSAGAVAGVHHIKNPIDAAIAVMQNSKHVMMAGEGAEKFAKEQGIELVDADYFYTKRRYEQLKNARNRSQQQGYNALPYQDYKYGTVGAVALDKYGNIVAGTSTGGMTNKQYGRVGDSPIIGAGTYAYNETCGISATGHGEYFIRSVAAYDVSALMKYKSYTIEKAGQEVIKKIEKLGGKGGLVGLDRHGNVMMSFSTEGMYRGYRKKGGETVILIYGNN